MSWRIVGSSPNPWGSIWELRLDQMEVYHPIQWSYWSESCWISCERCHAGAIGVFAWALCDRISGYRFDTQKGDHCDAFFHEPVR